jgi:hypothetical protein
VWWSLAEKTVRFLTEPRCDVTRSDAEIERVLAGSAPFAIARSAAAKIESAWTGSRTSRWLFRLVGDLPPLSMADRVRVAGCVATVGALIALGLDATTSSRTHWLDSFVPAAAAVAGVLVVAAARPIARALSDLRQ